MKTSGYTVFGQKQHMFFLLKCIFLVFYDALSPDFPPISGLEVLSPC